VSGSSGSALDCEAKTELAEDAGRGLDLGVSPSGFLGIVRDIGLG